MGERTTERISNGHSPVSQKQLNSPSQESINTTVFPTELVGRYSTQPSASASVTIITSANNSTLMESPSVKKQNKQAGRKQSSIKSKNSSAS